MVMVKTRLASLLALVLVLTVSVATAQEQASPAAATPVVADRKLDSLWTDFLHYIRVARPDLAKSYGQAILDSGAKAQDIYQLAAASPDAQATLGRGANQPELKDIVVRIQKMIEDGYQSDRANPKQIAEAIDMLGGTVRAFEMGKSRLRISGEFALPQIVQKLSDPRTPGLLKEKLITVLPSLGKGAVAGLCEALQSGDAGVLEIVASALGDIKYPSAGAALKELSLRKDIPERTRQVALAALASCAGGASAEKSPAELFYALATDYYYQADSVRPDARYATANVWYWQKGLGLTYKTVPSAIYGDIYAMRYSRAALKFDPKYSPAVSLWLSANLRKSVDLPAGATDPTAGEGELSAADYALASSAGYLQDVLGRALKDKNAAVALGAIQALSSTSGAKNLVQSVAGGQQPLVAALSFPDDQVRFLAALSLAQALPDKKFTGDTLVMPILAEVIRQTGKKTAMVVSADPTQRNAFIDALRAGGYDVIDRNEVEKALATLRESRGVSAVILCATPAPADFLSSLRKDALLSNMPVILADDSAAGKALAEKFGKLVLVASDAKSDALSKAIQDASAAAGAKPMSSQQAADHALIAANAVRMLGLTGSTVFDVVLTRDALAAAMKSSSPEMALASAEALAAMNDAAAQKAIAQQALSSGIEEGLRVKLFAALSESLRRFGNKLDDAQATAVMDIVLGKSSAALRTAASQALGAMNLPSEKIKDLILQAPAR
jgi:hypothetical protein